MRNHSFKFQRPHEIQYLHLITQYNLSDRNSDWARSHAPQEKRFANKPTTKETSR